MSSKDLTVWWWWYLKFKNFVGCETICCWWKHLFDFCETQNGIKCGMFEKRNSENEMRCWKNIDLCTRCSFSLDNLNLWRTSVHQIWSAWFADSDLSFNICINANVWRDLYLWIILRFENHWRSGKLRETTQNFLKSFQLLFRFSLCKMNVQQLILFQQKRFVIFVITQIYIITFTTQKHININLQVTAYSWFEHQTTISNL